MREKFYRKTRVESFLSVPVSVKKWNVSCVWLHTQKSYEQSLFARTATREHA